MREFASYVQDTWRATPKSHPDSGLRWDRQGAVQNLDNLYTRPGFAGLFGVSGVGNLFKPGVLAGSAPVFSLVPPGVGGFDPGVGHFSPSDRACLSHSPNGGILHWLTGDDAVLRARVQRLHHSPGNRLPGWRLERQSGPQPRHQRQRQRQSDYLPGRRRAFQRFVLSRRWFPVRSILTSPIPPSRLAVQSGQSVEDYNPQHQAGICRKLDRRVPAPVGKNTVVEVRYVANHGVDLWSAVNLNEVNTVEIRLLRSSSRRRRITWPSPMASRCRNCCSRRPRDRNQTDRQQLRQPGIARTGGRAASHHGDRKQHRPDHRHPAHARPGRRNRQWHRHQRYAHGESHQGGISRQPLPGEPQQRRQLHRVDQSQFEHL